MKGHIVEEEDVTIFNTLKINMFRGINPPKFLFGKMVFQRDSWYFIPELFKSGLIDKNLYHKDFFDIFNSQCKDEVGSRNIEKHTAFIKQILDDIYNKNGDPKEKELELNDYKKNKLKLLCEKDVVFYDLHVITMSVQIKAGKIIELDSDPIGRLIGGCMNLQDFNKENGHDILMFYFDNKRRLKQ